MELFEPQYLGNLKVNNRFIRSATHERGANPDGSPGLKVAETYYRLAKGGIGAIITSYTRISKKDQPGNRQIGIWDDGVINDYKKLTKIVHDENTPIIMQLVHGSNSSQQDPDTAPLYGPSTGVHPGTGLSSKEMTKDDMEAVKKLFTDAALRAKRAGFDGVQIHAAHGFLLSQFLSPLFNKRTDEYGGSPENRIRYIVEIGKAVREKVGTDYPLWIKINSSDEEEGGYTTEDFWEMIPFLDDFDVIEISGNHWSDYAPADRLYYRDAALGAVRRTDTPLILTGGIRSTEDVLGLYRETKQIFYGMARPLLKNPSFINTLKEEYEKG